jgi:hypothetical protein
VAAFPTDILNSILKLVLTVVFYLPHCLEAPVNSRGSLTSCIYRCLSVISHDFLKIHIENVCMKSCN